MSKVLVDIGSTYFKVATNKKIQHHFRNFDISIYDDLTSKCGDILNSIQKMIFAFVVLQMVDLVLLLLV